MMKPFFAPLVLALVWSGTSAPLARADAIRLRIIGPDKKPVAGASVRVLEYRGYWVEAAAGAPLDLKADASGKVAFESKKPLVATPKTARNVSEMRNANSVWVRVVAPGMAFAAQSVHAGDNEIVLGEGVRFGGAVQDEAGKPVAGVRIELDGVGAPASATKNAAKGGDASRSADAKSAGAKSVYFPGALRPSTLTDAAGKWSFAAMPRVGVARIRLNSPRFVRESMQIAIGPGGAPPLWVERGASIKGRVLRPDGTGAAGVALYPGGESDYEVRTDFTTRADGRFEIGGLRAGTYYLQHLRYGSVSPLPFVLEAKSLRALKVGENRDIGDWKAQAGVEVRGKIVVAGTKTPLAGASVMIYGQGSTDGESDKNGAFSLRSAPKNRRFYITARGFVPVQKPLPKPVLGVLNLGTIEMERGFAVQGSVRDKNGRGVPGLQLYLQGARNQRAYANTDAAGNFSFEGLQPGEATLRVEGAKLVSEVPVVVVRGRKTAPIRAVVDMTVGPEAPRTLAGRTLDGAGKPVAGVKLALRFQRGYSGSSVTALSGIDGRFEAPIYLPGATPQVTSARRPGYNWTGGEFAIVDGVWQADLQLQPLGAMLRGRVVDGAGKPRARVWVSSVGRADLPIAASDAGGAFVLPGVMLEGATLIVSDGRFYGEVKPASDGTVAMPAPPLASEDAAILAERLLLDAKFDDPYGSNSSAMWETLGAARLESAIRDFRFDGTNWTWKWNEMLRQLARLDPAGFTARGDELLNLTTEIDPQTEALLAKLRARSADPAQRERARLWLEKRGGETLGMNAETVSHLLRLATVAHALQAGTGAKWVDFAAQIAAQVSDGTRAGGAQEWGAVAAAIGMPAFENLILEWNERAKFNAYHGALNEFCATKNLARSRVMLARMEALFPAANKIKNPRGSDRYLPQPQDQLRQARHQIARLLVVTNPQAAFELSKTGSPRYQTSLLMEIAKNAARLGQIPLARQALRKILTSRSFSAQTTVEAAKIALQFDPKLADELFAKARASLKPRSDTDWNYRPSIDTYAVARAKTHAGEGRILLEREWRARLKAYQAPTDEYFVNRRGAALVSLVGAMAHFDTGRALEMVEQLPDEGNMRAQARGKIALALLTKP